MPKITILGAGITGLAIASLLPRDYSVTIVARNHPGDPDSLEWASPWAGAIWMPLYESDERELLAQLNTLKYLMELSVTKPESSVRQILMNEILDYVPDSLPWFRDQVPEWRILQEGELPKGARFGMSYRTVVLDPSRLIQFLKMRLEASGVKFKRMTVGSLSSLKCLGHDVLINASGLGALKLRDVKPDPELKTVFSQLVLVKTDYDRIFMRHGKDYSEAYTYVLPRLDGTAALGGIREYDPKNFNFSQNVKEKILERVHRNLPSVFPSRASEFEVVKDIIGLQPQRESSFKLETEVLDGQKVVHAYGIRGGGYIVSFGLALEAIKLINDFQFLSKTLKGSEI